MERKKEEKGEEEERERKGEGERRKWEDTPMSEVRFTPMTLTFHLYSVYVLRGRNSSPESED